MKFENGMKIRVRSDLVADTWLGADKNYLVDDVIMSLTGKVLRIKAITEYGDAYTMYGISELWGFTDEMLEDLPVDSPDICNKCGKVIDDINNVVYDKFGQPYCKDCAQSLFATCAGSGATIDLLNDDYVEHDGKYFTKKYFNDNYTKCNICGKYHLKTELSPYNDNDYVCNTCITEHDLVKCQDCGKYFAEDKLEEFDGSLLCSRCLERKLDYVILDYHEFDSDDWDFKKTSNEGIYTENTIGFELEVERHDSSVSRKLQAYKTKKTGNGLVIIERDGSLDNGFEIISHPMTYDYIRSNNQVIRNIIDELHKADYQGDKVNTAGLHFHVGKSNLATHSRNIDQVIDNILLITETFKNEISVFARRKSNDYARFMTSEASGLSLKKIKALKRENCNGRYSAVNITNSRTIEFRMFKSTTDYNTFMASVELVNNIVNIAKYEDLQGLSWKDVVNYKKDLNSFIVEYANGLGINSDIKISVLSGLETNPDNYNIENLLKTNFAIQMDRMDTRHLHVLTGILMTKGIVAREGYTTLSQNLRDYYNCGYVFYIENVDGKLTFRRRVSREIEVVMLSDLVELYEYRTDLLM